MTRYRQPRDLENDGLFESQHHSMRPNLLNPRGSGERLNCLIHVLCRLPEGEYLIVKQKAWILMPEQRVSGWNGCIPSDKTEISYLPPCLENDIECRLLVAHEIAHSICGHASQPSSWKIEDEAWEMAIRLGFATDSMVRELRQRRGLYPDSLESDDGAL
jgi:hypothetical protein